MRCTAVHYRGCAPNTFLTAYIGLPVRVGELFYNTVHLLDEYTLFRPVSFGCVLQIQQRGDRFWTHLQSSSGCVPSVGGRGCGRNPLRRRWDI
jgi:hypothetical protein